MANEKPEDFEFNALNNVSRPKNRGRKYDPYTSNFRNLTRRLQQDHFTEDALKGMYQFRAIVLRVETEATFSVTDPDSWGSLDLFGDEAPKLQVLKVRIPEIHAAMPIPEAYGDAPDDAGKTEGPQQGQINNYYPTVVAASEDLPIVKAGDVINVAFGSLNNLTDGIYLSKIKAGEAGTVSDRGSDSTTGGKKAFDNGGKGPLDGSVLGGTCKVPKNKNLKKLHVWVTWPRARSAHEELPQRIADGAKEFGATDVYVMMNTAPSATGVDGKKGGWLVQGGEWRRYFKETKDRLSRVGVRAHLIVWAQVEEDLIRKQAEELIPYVNEVKPASLQFDMEGEWIRSRRLKKNEELYKQLYAKAQVPIDITGLGRAPEAYASLLQWLKERSPSGGQVFVQAYSGQGKKQRAKTVIDFVKRRYENSPGKLILGFSGYDHYGTESIKQSLQVQINCALTYGYNEIAIFEMKHWYGNSPGRGFYKGGGWPKKLGSKGREVKEALSDYNIG